MNWYKVILTDNWVHPYNGKQTQDITLYIKSDNTPLLNFLKRNHNIEPDITHDAATAINYTALYRGNF